MRYRFDLRTDEYVSIYPEGIGKPPDVTDIAPPADAGAGQVRVFDAATQTWSLKSNQPPLADLKADARTTVATAHAEALRLLTDHATAEGRDTWPYKTTAALKDAYADA